MPRKKKSESFDPAVNTTRPLPTRQRTNNNWKPEKSVTELVKDKGRTKAEKELNDMRLRYQQETQCDHPGCRNSAIHYPSDGITGQCFEHADYEDMDATTTLDGSVFEGTAQPRRSRVSTRTLPQDLKMLGYGLLGLLIWFLLKAVVVK